MTTAARTNASDEVAHGRAVQARQSANLGVFAVLCRYCGNVAERSAVVAHLKEVQQTRDCVIGCKAQPPSRLRNRNAGEREPNNNASHESAGGERGGQNASLLPFQSATLLPPSLKHLP